MKTAMIIGGNGFVGRHAAVAFNEQGYRTIIFDPSLNRGAPAAAPRLPDGAVEIEGSVTDPEAVKGAVQEFRPTVICLLAAFDSAGQGLITAAEGNPRAAIEVNVVGLLNVLEAASNAGVRVLWSSSTTVYGKSQHYPEGDVDEQSLLGPNSVYAATKVAGEQLIRTYRSRGVDATAIRPTLVWGPGIRYRGAQAGLGDMVEAAATGESATVAALTEPWDLLYVADVGRVFAHLASMPSLPEVLIANGYQASVDDVRHAITELRPDAPITVSGEASPLGLPYMRTDAIRGHGYVPRYDLHSSIADYLSVAAQNGRNKQ